MAVQLIVLGRTGIRHRAGIRCALIRRAEFQIARRHPRAGYDSGNIRVDVLRSFPACGVHSLIVGPKGGPPGRRLPVPCLLFQ